jgi:2-polyprenyl-3-methyl-5-hydroxy-6-metoxy-1,4-benzoquinol methylase
MTTDGELRYFEAIGPEGRAHAVAKPFSDPNRGGLLLEVGALLSLLPVPPARVLDCGCGTGWLTWILARSGYSATGIDVAPAAIDLALASTPLADDQQSPQFLVGDVQDLSFEDEFDAVVFFDALHHTIDERATLRAVLRALRPGGVCVTSEPGKGHADASAHEVDTYGVTERDMPAHHIASVARSVGFASTRIHARADAVGFRLYGRPDSDEAAWRQRLRRNPLVRSLLTLRTTELAKRDNGMVVLQAPG